MSEEDLKIEPVSEQEATPGSGSFIWELVRVVLFSFIFMIGFRYFVAEPFVVSGSSMVPNFFNREYLVVDKLSYRFGEIDRGDVIVFRYPKDPSQYFIKRVIGLPGEKVKIQSGKAVIYNNEFPDGKVLAEPYLPNQDITFGQEDIVTLQSGEYFVMGDNRLGSSDSRMWGKLPESNIVGKAWLRVFPVNRFGVPDFPAPALVN